MRRNKRPLSEECHDSSRTKRLCRSVKGQGRSQRNDSRTRQSRRFSQERREIDRNGDKNRALAELQQKRDPNPLNYMALDKICKSNSPDEGILELFNNSKRFEALLKTETIRPDLMKLVIRAIHMCCSPNDKKEIANKMLRTVIKTHFLQLHINKFISEMSNVSEFGNNYQPDELVLLLAEVFLELLQRFEQDVVHFIPNAQLSETVGDLKSRGLLQDAEMLEKKLQQVKEYKDEINRRKTTHPDESQLTPPEDFRYMSVIPQVVDLEPHNKPFLRKNVVGGNYLDQEHYLDVQFRLLREDFILPLRNGIKQLKKDRSPAGASNVSHSKRARDVPVYRNVTILYPVCSGKGMVYRIRFDSFHRDVRHVKWEKKSKLFKFGSLLCLSADEFRTLLFATVENRDSRDLCVGELEVRFEDAHLETLNQLIEDKEKFDMVESPAFFQAYRHVLEGLQEIKDDELPFAEHIVQCNQDVKPPAYENKSRGFFDMSGIIEEGVDLTAFQASNTMENMETESVSREDSVVSDYHDLRNRDGGSDTKDADWGTPDLELLSEVVSASLDIDLESVATYELSINGNEGSNEGTPVDERPAGVLNIYDLELNPEDLGFNKSQMSAFKMALTKNFAVIQGPPGTGKTYVGRKIARVLLQSSALRENENEPSPILMVSYTNHALDDFLSGLPKEGIVRVGGRNCEKLKGCTLRDRREEAAANKLTPYQIYRARKNAQWEIKELNRDGALDLCITVLKYSRRRILAFRVLEKFMLARHARWFKASQEDSDSLLCEWLNLHCDKERKDSKSNGHDMDRNKDFHMQESARNFSNEDDYEDIEEDEAVKPADVTIGTTENTAKLRRDLLRDKVMSDREERNSRSDLLGFSRRDRWNLYRLWLQKAEKYYMKKLQGKQPDFERALARKFDVMREEDFHVLQSAKIIGMTTTCAARYRRTLQRIRPKIVLVEEAAEVLEAHIITSLTKECQHLILIGDHKQLRPKPEVFELAMKYHLDVSLFERMVKVGLYCETLNVQHRMRPEIASLMKHIYDDLENHESVEEYEDIKGIKKNMFFINHSHLENPFEDSNSHVNDHEVQFLVALCRYLLQQGYEAHQITLLTTYTGQMFAIRDCVQEKEIEDLNQVSLTTVDNFQGEENDIILLSLVRSNKDDKAGFIQTENRACVALSRARKGFYCIGNFALLCKHSDVWSKVIDDLKVSGSFGEALPLICQSHKEEITAKTAEDFEEKAPNGGCQRPCEVRLDCGHACKRSCHPFDVEHLKYVCKEQCARYIVGCDHMCRNLCYQKCEKDCGALVERTLPSCGHKTTVRCGMSLNKANCKEQCEKILPCSHRCQSRCGQTCTKKCLEPVNRTDWPCGHGENIACSTTPADCPKRCRTLLECGHPCSGNCGECRMGRVHKRCKNRCKRVLVCSHECLSSCTGFCPPCRMSCENRCTHSNCKRSCGKACEPCAEKCNWECFHFRCSKLCGELCDRPRCDQPCKKFLRCGSERRPHRCRGLCGEKCICVVCTNNDGDPITKTFLGGEDEKDARFIQLPDCKHIFAVKDLDYYMGTSHLNEENCDVIQLKTCPRCKKGIRTSLRYGNIIKQQLLDIEKVKAKVNGNPVDIQAAKKDLEIRLRVLKPMLEVEEDKRDLYTLQRRVTKMSNMFIAAITTNQVMLMRRFAEIKQKLKDNQFNKTQSQVSNESRVEEVSLQEDLKYLKKRAISEEVTERELKDINLECTRVNLRSELYLLKDSLTSFNLTLEESHGQVLKNVCDELSTGKIIQVQRLDELLDMLSEIRKAYPRLLPLTPEEKQQIVTAMGLKQGHWYKCPKGHIYAITECGRAMEKSTCPDCGAVIGGESHRLVEDNEVATEMVGARYPAWSEQANMENYMIDEA
ncbi:NFX1-type zinc finger-containing protein 1-like [Stylophora pistillata]|uniref:NFX1-type zinc finger-containing protein 1 n=1 Tax=Stylophora pistillata TaxID=50429 RepID=A0A2B4RVS6_STYPI|nr:NFX1-type zinc finger-containing protein 1-like [Stylophora pistillata]PFX21266.1 NFX1-type zinc finger-containing protein 1 [Stylophora pistillata]